MWAAGSRKNSDFGEEMVLPERFELSTSPLPRECSTPELRQRCARVYAQIRAWSRGVHGFWHRNPRPIRTSGAEPAKRPAASSPGLARRPAFPAYRGGSGHFHNDARRCVTDRTRQTDDRAKAGKEPGSGGKQADRKPAGRDDAREARLAAALRANLRRRKAAGQRDTEGSSQDES